VVELNKEAFGHEALKQYNSHDSLQWHCFYNFAHLNVIMGFLVSEI
jgi:hypothetical protein